METITINTITNKEVNHMKSLFELIDTSEWNWDYDCGMSFIDKQEEIEINDEYFIDFNIKVWRDSDGNITETVVNVNDFYKGEENVEITDYQHEIIAQSIIKNLR